MFNRTRRDVLRSTAAVATTAAVAGLANADSGSRGVAGSPTASDVSLAEEFDALQADWRVDSDLASPAGGEYWDVGITAPSSMDSRTVRFVADGRASTGMAWIYAPVEIDPGVEYEGELTVRAWSSDAAEEDPTRLCAYLGPDLPTTAEDFPGPRESWFYEGRETGLNASLWEDAGWNEYTTRWATPAFETDQIYVAVGIETDAAGRFVHHVDAIDLELTPASSTSSISVADATVTTTDETITGEREVRFDDENDVVDALGTISLPTGCHEPVVAETTYDEGGDELAVMLGTENPTPDAYCTEAVENETYRLTVDCDGGLPGSVTVVTPDGESISAADSPTMTGVELVDADASQDNGINYDDATETVTVEDTVEFTNGCQYLTVPTATFDADTDTLTVDVGIEEEGEVCTEEVVERSFVVRATFEGGLPGTVDYDGPLA